MVEVSVVVPSLEPADDVDVVAALERCERTDYEVIARREPTVTAARNEGIRRAEADKIVFLDDDSRPRPGYLDRAATLLDREAAVTGRTVHPRDDVFDRLAGHYDFGDEGRYVTRFWGCNAAMRREVFDDVGLWDEGFGWGHEEKELADRVLEEHPIYYDPELVVDHPYADSIASYWVKQYRLGTQAPKYWDSAGVPEGQQWIRIARTALDPTNYAGLSLPHTAARFGGNVATTLGRVRGMYRIE